MWGRRGVSIETRKREKRTSPELGPVAEFFIGCLKLRRTWPARLVTELLQHLDPNISHKWGRSPSWLLQATTEISSDICGDGFSMQVRNGQSASFLRPLLDATSERMDQGEKHTRVTL